MGPQALKNVLALPFLLATHFLPFRQQHSVRSNRDGELEQRAASMEDSLSCDGQVDASELIEVDPKRRLRLMHRAATAASKVGAAAAACRPRCSGARGRSIELSQQQARSSCYTGRRGRTGLSVCASFTFTLIFYKSLEWMFSFLHFIQEGQPFHRKGKIHSDKHHVASAKLRN